eukprot:scaffold17019_cov24-Tisochrysis_lutea.AAC.1
MGCLAVPAAAGHALLFCRALAAASNNTTKAPWGDTTMAPSRTSIGSGRICCWPCCCCCWLCRRACACCCRGPGAAAAAATNSSRGSSGSSEAAEEAAAVDARLLRLLPPLPCFAPRPRRPPACA